MHYDKNDIAPCRACGVAPDYRKASSDAYYLRCPECGIKTGTSTGGLDALVPKWNAVMDDDWPNTDPRTWR